MYFEDWPWLWEDRSRCQLGRRWTKIGRGQEEKGSYLLKRHGQTCDCIQGKQKSITFDGCGNESCRVKGRWTPRIVEDEVVA